MVSALVLVALVAQGQAAPPPAPPALAQGAAYIPQRVYDTRRKAFTDFESMLADLGRADVVLVGEQHDDAATHRLEAAVLGGLMRRSVAVTVSLEMFERDVQPQIDAYLAGAASEEEFLKSSRPWPRYATDYRALVEMAKAHHWPVVAANVPRRLASEVSKTGKQALGGVSASDRPFIAREVQCPSDAYFDRFAEQMGGHPAAGADAASAAQTTERYYWAQCLKDETMAESIAAAFEKSSGRPGTIVHFTGAFHSDFGTGTAERVRRRLPGRRVAVVSMIPTENLDTVVPGDDDLQRAEYLVYTVK